MASINIKAETREISTKGAVNKLRKDGYVPGVLYSKEMDALNFTVEELILKPVIYTAEMNLVDLKIGDGKVIKCILKDVQFDPVTDRIVHVDFQAITVGQVIQLQVPISFVGQAIGVKEGGKLSQNLHKLDIECLPKHIPKNFEIDLTNLNVGDSIQIRDLSFENIKILNSENATVVSIFVSRDVEEDTTDDLLGESDTVETEVIEKGKSEE